MSGTTSVIILIAMGENPKYPKIIERPDPDNTELLLGEMKGKIKYTSDWESVEGGKGVSCRTWVIEGVDSDVDGADIEILEGGYTPIQLVKAANVVVDAPEEGKAFSVVMDTDSKIYVNHFDGQEKNQMVWSEGMVITWIAETDVRLSEFESPSFSDGMFENITEDTSRVNNLPMDKYLQTVKELRSSVKL